MNFSISSLIALALCREAAHSLEPARANLAIRILGAMTASNIVDNGEPSRPADAGAVTLADTSAEISAFSRMDPKRRARVIKASGVKTQ